MTNIVDPFNQGDPFSGSKGSTSIDANVGSKADKIHIRTSSFLLHLLFAAIMRLSSAARILHAM